MTGPSSMTGLLDQEQKQRRKYHVYDKPGTTAAVESEAPQSTPALGSLRSAVFDADQVGSSAVDFKFGASLFDMSQEELTQTVHDLNRFCREMSFDACFLLIPAPGDANFRSARIIAPPDKFVLGLRPMEREAWLNKWEVGCPVGRAYREPEAIEATSWTEVPKKGMRNMVNKAGGTIPVTECKFFNKPGGCYLKDRCPNIHCSSSSGGSSSSSHSRSRGPGSSTSMSWRSNSSAASADKRFHCIEVGR